MHSAAEFYNAIRGDETFFAGVQDVQTDYPKLSAYIKEQAAARGIAMSDEDIRLALWDLGGVVGEARENTELSDAELELVSGGSNQGQSGSGSTQSADCTVSGMDISCAPRK